MKKIIALLLCFVMLFALCACGKGEPASDDNAEPEVTEKADDNTEAKESAEDEDTQQEGEEPSVGMPNPMSEYESLDDVNKAVGGNLSSPGVMGASDEAYLVIDCGSYQIGEYRFNVNGCDYTLRCAKAKEDISGIYLSGQEGTAFSSVDGTSDGEEIADGIIVYSDDQTEDADSTVVTADSGMQLNSDGEYKCARWFVGDMQYVLTAHDGGKLDDETFSSAANEFMNKTQGNM